jgi:hypothetical protein
MTAGNYLFRVSMTGFDSARDKELQETIGRFQEKAGSAQLGALLRGVQEGEPAVVYQSNSRRDAEMVADTLKRAGAEVEVEW